MGFLLLGTFLAQTIPSLPNQGVQNPCGNLGISITLPCPSQPGFAAIYAFVTKVQFMSNIQAIFIAVASLMFLYYAVRLLIEGDEESTVSEVRSAYSYGITGAAIVSLTSLIVQAVGQNTTTNVGLVDTTAALTAIGRVTIYYRYMVAAAVSAIIVYQGIRLIVAQGDDAEMQKQKKSFLYTLVGVSVILLVNSVIEAFVIPLYGGTGNSGALALEIVGIANFLLELLGALAVLTFIAAGFFLVISTDDSLKEKAKKTMFTTVVTLIIVLVCRIVISFVINL